MRLRYPAERGDANFKQRLATFFQILGMVIDFEPSALCRPSREIALAPLPAKKQLWEAGNEQAWREETKREGKFYESLALAANGELIKLGNGQPHWNASIHPANGSSKITANWAEWCSGTDGFGGLIMPKPASEDHPVCSLREQEAQRVVVPIWRNERATAWISGSQHSSVF